MEMILGTQITVRQEFINTQTHSIHTTNMEENGDYITAETNGTINGVPTDLEI